MAMKIVIDSNRYTDLCHNVLEVIEIVERASLVFVPLIVIAELRAGFANGNQQEKNERILTKFLNKDEVSILYPDEQTTHFYANLYYYLRKKGKPIPTNDLWIAALVVQYNLTLYDRDSDLDNLPQLSRIGR